MMNVIIRDELEDRDYIERHTLGSTNSASASLSFRLRAQLISAA